ncbi:MAG: ATP-binding protein, partial [Planctomycetota bacterium]
MHQQFINRERELEFLESRYRSGNPEFIILYGRRRIGKTRLITEFLQDKTGIYFLCASYSEIENLRLLQAQMSEFLKDESFKKLRIAGFEELFHEFFKWFKKKERIVLVIDEFPYLIALNSGVISIFQRIWDLNLSRQNVMLILCGSSIGMMETEVLGYKSPLYGRRTGQWRLGKLGFEYLRRFFPGYSTEDIIRVYGCLDSIPEYLLKFPPNLGFWENLRRNFVSKGSFLYEEAEILLREEFREPRNYTLILRAIAEGSRKLAQIASATGIDKGALSRYIHNLQRVGIVDAELPATFPKKSKRSLYKLTDNYFKFYFRFVLPNKNNIE